MSSYQRSQRDALHALLREEGTPEEVADSRSAALGSDSPAGERNSAFQQRLPLERKRPRLDRQGSSPASLLRLRKLAGFSARQASAEVSAPSHQRQKEALASDLADPAKGSLTRQAPAQLRSQGNSPAPQRDGEAGDSFDSDSSDSDFDWEGGGPSASPGFVPKV